MNHAELLYRASRDGFHAHTYQDACANRANTLTLMRQKGAAASDACCNLFAAFTPSKWTRRLYYGANKSAGVCVVNWRPQHDTHTFLIDVTNSTLTRCQVLESSDDDDDRTDTSEYEQKQPSATSSAANNTKCVFGALKIRHGRALFSFQFEEIEVFQLYIHL